MTRPTRTRLRGAELEEAILEAAESCFERFGIAKTTMDDVAKVAEVSRGTVYRYFADRESLILASIRRRSRMNLAPARVFIAGFPDIADKLAEGICHSVRRGRRDPMVHLLVSPDEMPLATSLLGATGVAAELTHELWEPILREAQEAGRLRAEIELRELSEWISHLEIMFITQFARDDASLDRFRDMIRKFLVPAVVR
ncbi:TetR/AcrR family transcriptional regulator [Actinomadura sp. LOL_016]|uniref:TetR/AcrR family transcriptional regulator n=1 Tax=unclassified Actinomadura TaxID=2626254 RepID=UPI003A8067E4